MSVELPHLRHFFEVARQGGFTRAAQVLRAQQPGMSRSVRLLEERLGVRLIDRDRRRFVLTAAGERVYAACQRIFADVELIERIGEEERGAPTGTLRIAAGGVLASRVLPDALPALLARYPRLWPMVYAAPSAMGMQRIAAGELELGLYLYTPEVPPTLVCTPFAEMAFRLVVRADRAKDREVVASFIGSREVEDPRATKFPTLERLRARYPDASIRLSSNDTEAHLRMVEAGLGVSILPELLVADGLARGTLVDVLRGERFRFPVLLVTRASHSPTRGAQALLDEVTRVLHPTRRSSATDAVAIEPGFARKSRHGSPRSSRRARRSRSRS